MSITVTSLMQQRRDTAANWTSNNPTLLNGEIGYETDTGYLKIGDGSTAWTSLGYVDGTKVSAYPLATVDIADDAITAAKLADTSVTAGNYTAADITVDAQGRITAAASGSVGSVTSVDVAGGTGLSASGGPVTSSGTITLSLDNTAVTAGSYTAADITIDAQGRITAAANGTTGAAAIADGSITSAKLENNITIAGNLTVNGTTTTVNSTTLTVDDKNIELGSVATPTDTTADGGGITLKGATDHTIVWTNSTDSWDFSEHVNIASGKEFKIAGTSVLSATTLGSAVVNSSLTSVGTIATGTWSASTIAVDKGGTGQTSYTDGQLLIGNTTGNTLSKATLTAGSGVSITNGSGSIEISATGSGGTVTSVDVSGGTGLTATGGPITGSGTITVDLDNTAVTPGSYTLSSITVDAQGRITAASSGSAGAGDKITEGNTEAEVVDTGSDGHFKVTTEGVERIRVGPAGQIGIAGANYGTAGQLLSSGGASGVVAWVDAVVIVDGGNFANGSSLATSSGAIDGGSFT